MLPVTHTNQFRPIAVIAVLLLVSLLSSGTTWAKSPSWCNFDPGCVGKRVTPASGPNLCLASTPEFAMQSVLYDSITKARSKWPDNAHGWGKAAIYGLEFAGAAIPIYGSFALMPVLIPKGENVVQDPDAGFTAFTLFTAGQLVGPSMTMEVGRLLHQQGDVPNTCTSVVAPGCSWQRLACSQHPHSRKCLRSSSRSRLSFSNRR